jgi:hypothetical protein
MALLPEELLHVLVDINYLPFFVCYSGDAVIKPSLYVISFCSRFSVGPFCLGLIFLLVRSSWYNGYNGG